MHLRLFIQPPGAYRRGVSRNYPNSHKEMNTIIREFESSVEGFINRGRLLRKGPGAAPVLVGVSGGADSVALLLVLGALGYEVRAAHCNFHLRGAESQRDMRHVEALCDRLGVDLYVRDFNVEARMAATGESVEMACRALRYDWFASLLDREYAQALAVGHHREDQAETIILNLLRGTGPMGLRGMPPRRTDGPGGLTLVRPLLECSRPEIEAYLRARGVEWVDDSSNAADEYRRNRIRNHLLPLMEELQPGAIDGILRTAVQTGEAMALYSAGIESLRARYFAGQHLDIAGLLQAVGAQSRMALWELLRPMGFTMTQVENILRGAGSGASGIGFKAPGYRAELSRGVLRIESATKALRPSEAPVLLNLRRDIVSPLRISVSYHPIEDFPRESHDNPRVTFVDASAAESGRWELRTWRHGDRMQPFGMKGTKLLSDIFSDAKLDASAKREARILTRNGEIIWIAGIRRSALHAVGPATRRYLRLELE